MTSTSHLDALNLRLSHERGYLAQATKAGEIELRTVWIAQIEKEIASEIKFLSARGVDVDASVIEMNDDDLLAELMA